MFAEITQEPPNLQAHPLVMGQEAEERWKRGEKRRCDLRVQLPLLVGIWLSFQFVFRRSAHAPPHLPKS